MTSVGVLPALALLAGAACGALGWTWTPLLPALVVLVIAGWIGWRLDWPRLALAALVAALFCAGLALAGDARATALHTPLREILDREFGGFSLDTLGPGGRHDPVSVRATLLEDASRGDNVTSMRAMVQAVRLRGQWHEVSGGITLSVGGRASPSQAGEWRAGRRVEMPVTFRRPARYLNEGVPDFERDLALDGTTLFGSVKSGFLVEVRARGTVVQEAAARVRAHVRRSLERWVAPHDPISAAIVTAVLIGDRTGLPDDIRLRLQAAGTYHVIAISGGNIAILAGLALFLLLLLNLTGRPAALVTIAVLLGYAQVVTAGASVWRATLMATLYLAARVMDHRSPAWHAMAVAAALVVCARPLDVRNVGFILTFGATAALLEGARRAARLAPHSRWAAWLIASLAASFAAEIALLPVSAWTFSRVTSAGLVLNLLAVPLMGIVQVAGMVTTTVDGVEGIAGFGGSAAWAGWVAHAAASAIVSSARLVDLVPWLTARVPPPPVALVIAYYAGLTAALATRGAARAAGVAMTVVSAIVIATGLPSSGWLAATDSAAPLRLTVFDVGQGDAMLLQLPDRSSMLVDAGGIPFGGGSFDIGARVLAPALWARGVRSLATALLTHGDPDHIGGASSIVSDFEPAEVWEGIPVPRHLGMGELLALARRVGARVEQRQAGDEWQIGGARVRVLHPSLPDWERRRVRNDDSVVIEVRYGDVALLLAGDVSAEIERSVLPLLTPAPHRILKVAHHGSRTSTSRELLEHWRPQIAIISCGRGNTFGHPTPEVIQRLDDVGATIYRTDLHGQVTIETDGSDLQVKTYVGGPK